MQRFNLKSCARHASRVCFMKKFYFMLPLCVATLFVCSCGNDDEDGPVSPEPDPIPSGKVDPATEKEYLEATAKEFLGYYKADDFKNFTYMQDVVRGSDADELEDWAENIVEGLKKLVDTYTNEYGEACYRYNVVYAASSFNGQFTLVDGKWKKTGNGDGLSFNFTDSQGKQCVMTVKASGTETKVALGSDSDYDYYYDSYLGYYIWTVDKDDIFVMVPQKTQVVLTQGGNKVLDMNVDINIQGVNSDATINLDKTSFSLSSSTTVNGVYGIQVEKVSYVPNATIEGAFKLTRDGKTLLAVDATGKGRVHEDMSDKDDDEQYGEFELSEVNQITVNADVLGKVQVKATVKDGTKFNDYIELAEDNEYDESTFKRYINNANSLLTGYLYNNKSTEYVASVKLESFRKHSYSERWSYRPLMEFSDGTSYTFDEYFDEVAFRSVVNLAEDILSDFEHLFDD